MSSAQAPHPAAHRHRFLSPRPPHVGSCVHMSPRGRAARRTVQTGPKAHRPSAVATRARRTRVPPVAHQQLQVAHQQLQVAHQQLQVAHQQLQAPHRGVGHRVHAPGSGSEEGTLTSQQGWPQGQRVKYEVRGANPPRVWAAAGRLQARRRSPACQPLSLGKKVANASLPLLDERARARASVSELVERVPLQQRAPARPPRREPRAL